MPFSYQSIILVVPTPIDQKLRVFEWLESIHIDTTSVEMKVVNEDNEAISVDTIRVLQKELSYGVAHNNHRVVIILSSDLLSLVAQQASLKLLEEPPANTTIILVTSSLSSLLPTVQSRCQIIYDKSPKAEPASLTDHYSKITTSNFGQLIELSEKYSSKDQALQLLSELVHESYRLLSNCIESEQNTILNSKKYHTIIKDIVLFNDAYKKLKQNGNVVLILSECFFSVKQNNADFASND